MYFILTRSHKPSANVNACAKLVLPGIDCGTCDKRWASTNIVFPDIEVPKALVDLRPNPVSDIEFKAIIEQFGDLPEYLKRNLLPGVWVGPLIGKVRGKIRDINWVGDSLPLFHLDFLKQLPADVTLPNAVPCEFIGDLDTVLHCCSLPLSGTLHESSFDRYSQQCSVCGFRSITVGEEISLRESPECKYDLFRLTEAPGYVVATERFREALSKLHVDTATFTPLHIH